ncbi:MAG: ABC transporter substrate-binding protein [Rhodospirillaceae bacterium]|nr:ABC transporter substrate-binding protein [Rhodospirillaceae bacterium]MYB13144.1 ABC transporter substrate-binding protein [Rhodospirillaceae bacterium]MYI48297.1 ABC transporter substrate-binding protein [Rhodospirillaceae bacterium]
MIRLHTFCAAALAAGMASGLGAGPASAEKMTYLFPAPPILPSFGPLQLAKQRGYFKAAGLEVAFATAKGGVDVAKQVGVGNAEMGGGLADSPIIVRAQGIPVRSVVAFGGRGFMQLVVREDSGITTPAGLKGKNVSVMSYQDTTYYALRGMLAATGLKVQDINAMAVGPRAVPGMVIQGKAVGCACVPDWIPPIQAAKIKIRIIKSEDYFPHMAQASLASDKLIAANPALIKKFVGAVLKGMKDVMDNPAGAAKDFAKAAPMWKGKEGYVTAVFKYFAELVYPGQKVLGEIDAKRLAKLQEFYVAQGIVRKKVPLDDLYTNRFVTGK